MSHDGVLSNDLPPKPPPYAFRFIGWTNTSGYNGPVRPEKSATPPDEATLRAADAVADRRRNEYGSFVEAAAALAAANAAGRRRPRS